ncbi:hypothetical protein MN086_08595 [Sulfurovum sp. XGS-02]|uniref:NfrA family protein n=1 Tax=Sulfurovum sp. XGS-02 TaxID=2925411 RepID=UPI00206B7E35|nr:tetratricopeptide repeat protein [Sulfurovum sp. XGS-02]UPT77106.1 hypothetical protein MN086_08595 [Sulfurovum sp. XGS-02]
MKRILVLIPLYCMTFLNANVVNDSVDHVKEEFTEYRVYPRLQKADNYIAEGKIKEAKELLLKVLEIDPKNAKAGSRVVGLCMQDKDFECAEKYVGFIESPTYVKYYQGYISFQLKEYDKALKAAASIEDPTALKKSEQELNNHIILRSAIMSENKEAAHTYLKKIFHPKYNASSCPSESLEIIYLLFTHKLFDEAFVETRFYLDHCKSQKIPDEKLAIWSDLLRKENRFDQEARIIAYMEDVDLKNEHTLSMYLKSGDETKAIETMETIYQADPSDKNKVRLLYLYENAKMQDKIITLYGEVYELKKNPEDLKKVLYLNKEPMQQYQLLEKYYPYAGLTDEEKFNFSVSLIKFYKEEKKVTQILSIVDDLTHLETLTNKQKLYLSHQYSENHQDQKAIALMKALYQSDPRPQYKERLEYLRNRNIIPKKPQPKIVQKKPQVKPKPTREDKLRSETQMAYDLIHQKKYDEAVIHLNNVLKYEPNNPVRYEQLGQAYYAQEKYAPAAKAFGKAASLSPKSGYYESLGYCYIKLKKKKNAIENFKKSIDIVKKEEPENIDKLYQLKYSVAELDRKFFGYLTYGMRLDSYNNTRGISPILSANYGGFSALELHYKPEIFNDYATVYAKVLAGVRDQSLAIRSETWQPSIGVRFQPLEDERLYFFIEKFFKGGDESRDDTMLRASWEHFDGYDFYPTKTEYPWKHLYMDSVYYLDNGTYSLYANYEHGYVWKSGYQDAWMPYLCTSAGYTNDNGPKEALKRFDVGAGISYLFWRNEREYKSHQYTGRTRLEYRHQYAGDPEDDHALRLMLEFFF